MGSSLEAIQNFKVADCPCQGKTAEYEYGDIIKRASMNATTSEPGGEDDDYYNTKKEKQTSQPPVTRVSTILSSEKNISPNRVNDVLNTTSNKEEIDKRISEQYNMFSDIEEEESDLPENDKIEIEIMKQKQHISSPSKRDTHLLHDVNTKWDHSELNELQNDMNQQLQALVEHNSLQKHAISLPMDNPYVDSDADDESDGVSYTTINFNAKVKDANLYRIKSGHKWNEEKVHKQKEQMAKHLAHLASIELERTQSQEVAGQRSIDIFSDVSPMSIKVTQKSLGT